MKVSIAWIFDHINADWHTVDIEALVEKFNQTTAEIEEWYAVTIDPKNLFLGQALSQKACHLPDLKKDVSLSSRTDVKKGLWYLIKKEGTQFRWATSLDLGGVKEMILPAIRPDDWRQSFESKDYILEVDNKSITHRPDLWGSRGFAREIAAILNLKLKPYDKFLARKPIKDFARKAAGVQDGPAIAIEDPKNCSRFAGLFIPEITYTPSLIWMATRLSRVDSRSINALVDSTNYVMLDTSQPMHAFDANKIDAQIVARQARGKEKLELLDDQKLTLSDQDIVIADAKKALSLAGIMGGKFSEISDDTNSLFLESANFDAAMIRRSSQRYHVRSESSARFEKSLDPMQNVVGILRYLKLLDNAKITYTATPYISSVGKTFKAPQVSTSLSFIEDRLGVELKPSFVPKTLERIGFKVSVKEKKFDIDYIITVPLFRATKDIAQPEDIVEEIGRFYGYHTIPFILPERKTEPTNTHATTQEYNIKHQLAFGDSMHELYSCAFFDESFLREINWQPKNTVDVQDPVSENWYRLATTLMPHMLKAVRDNCNDQDELRFFEWGRVWHNEKKIIEQKKLTGIFYHKKQAINFYDAKARLDHLCAMLKLPVTWQSGKTNFAWMLDSHTAQLMHEDKIIGTAGIIDPPFMKQIADGSAFIFELDADFLEQYQMPIKKFVPLSKYPSIERDISMIVPLDITVHQITQKISSVDSLIVSVRLVDFFQKEEWKDRKAVTFRYIIRDKNKTLTGKEADEISNAVIKSVTTLGATVR